MLNNKRILYLKVYTTKPCGTRLGLEMNKPGNEKRESEDSLFCLAEWTGLEPATPGVTGRYSNQLNYRSTLNLKPMVGADGLEPPTFAL